MELTKEMFGVIADIEQLIGAQCYNPKSYDGWNDIEGCAFRYPVTVTNQDGRTEKIRSNICKFYQIYQESLTPKSFLNMKYKFGTNELLIGQGIIQVLRYLEERYNLNFNELEKAK